MLKAVEACCDKRHAARRFFFADPANLSALRHGRGRKQNYNSRLASEVHPQGSFSVLRVDSCPDSRMSSCCGREAQAFLAPGGLFFRMPQSPFFLSLYYSTQKMPENVRKYRRLLSNLQIDMNWLGLRRELIVFTAPLLAIALLPDLIIRSAKAGRTGTRP